MIRNVIAAMALSLLPVTLFAQTGGISFDTSSFDRSLPVEVTADSLTVSQDTGIATFSGQARVKQGELRLGADEITVIYNADQSQIKEIRAAGSVVFTDGTDTAEAQTAIYDIGSENVELSGDVLLLQGSTAIAGDRMDLDLKSGRASIQGNVRTTISAN